MPLVRFKGYKRSDIKSTSLHVADSNSIIRDVSLDQTVDLPQGVIDNLRAFLNLPDAATPNPAPPIADKMLVTSDIIDPATGLIRSSLVSGGTGGGGAGPAGPPGVNWRSDVNNGVFSATTAYSKGDGVTWLGSSYVALVDQAAGAVANPAVDQTKWMLFARGGGEIAAAEYVSPAGGYTVPVATTDLPGTQITVPGGAGPYELRLMVPWELTATAANGAAICSAFIYDIENSANIANAQYRIQVPVSGQMGTINAAAIKRMPASPTPRNFKVQTALILATATVKIRSDGVGAAPALLQAKSL